LKNNNADVINTFYIQIGKNVKRLRQEKGLSQLDLSHLMNFSSVSLVSQAEVFYNNQHFSLKHLYVIASILECDITAFFEGVEVESLEW